MSDNETDVTKNPFWGDPVKAWCPFGGLKLLRSSYITQPDTAFHVGGMYYVSNDTYSDIVDAFRSGNHQRVDNIFHRIIVVECGTLSNIFDRKDWEYVVDEIKAEKTRTKAEVEAEEQ